jgi:hypothetical protein
MAYVPNPSITIYTSGLMLGKIRLYDTTSETFGITWTDTALRDMLGFTVNLTGNYSYQSGNRMRNVWISDYTPSDRTWWALRHSDTYAGSLTRQGDLVGLHTGNSIYHRTLSFDAETGDNVFKSLCSTAEAEYSTLEHFVENVRSSAPAVSAHAPTHGFWYLYDVADFTIYDFGGAMSDYTGLDHSRYKWQWCHLSADGIDTPAPSLGNTRDWYSTQIKINTATPPTFDAA